MSYIGNQPTQVAFQTDTFSGNASTTAFTMSVAPAGTTSMLVAVTGVVQDPSTYSVVGTTLTFSQAPPTGTNNISVRYLGIPATGVTTTSYRTITNFTATGGQKTFSVPSYTVGYIDVYRNGVRLAAADYTATNGTTVVLTNAATAGDSVVTESFYVSSVLNAIPATAGAVNSTYIANGAVGSTQLATGGVAQSNLAANVAGNGPAFSAYQSSAQTISNGTFTKVNLQTEEFDTNNNFASSTFTPTVAGYYQISGGIYIGNTLGISLAVVYKNGSAYKRLSGSASPSNATNTFGSCLVYCNGSTDYIELYAFQNSGSSATVPFVTSDLIYFQAAMIRSA